MWYNGYLTSITKLLTAPLQSTKLQDLKHEIAERIGPLSHTSKMPCPSWGISAHRCLLGSQLAQIEGSICSHCYVKKGRYNFNRVQDTLERRYRGFADVDWVPLMALNITLHRTSHFRWFDSGDLQSAEMLAKIKAVARLTPDVEYWLPTQERGLVRQAETEDPCPPNLLIRLSTVMVDEVPNIKGWPWYSTAGSVDHREGLHMCPAETQDNKCQNCRACWDRRIEIVKYRLH